VTFFLKKKNRLSERCVFFVFFFKSTTPKPAQMTEQQPPQNMRHNWQHMQLYYDQVIAVRKQKMRQQKITGPADIPWSFDEFVRFDILFHTRTRSDDLDRVYLAPSSRHNQGVFSRHELKAGDIVTYYPADYVIIHTKTERHVVVSSTCPDLRVEDAQQAKDYELVLDKTFSIRGDPRKTAQTSCLGHMVNDCCVFPLEEASFPLPPFLPESKYDEQRSEFQNCTYAKLPNYCRMAVVAIKDIPANTELLSSYSYRYWVKKRVNQLQALDLMCCRNCAAFSSELATCGRCKLVWYCTKECQKQDWLEHKWICNAQHPLKK